MLGLTKPKHFIPMHGEFRMQVQHGRLATETGVAPENVFIIENGTPIEFYADGSARRAAPVAPATSTSTGCRSAMSATSSCATGAPSPTTGCS
jgi:ribonuclease J